MTTMQRCGRPACQGSCWSRHGPAAAHTHRSTPEGRVRSDEELGDRTHFGEGSGAREGDAGVAQRTAGVLLEEELGGEAWLGRGRTIGVSGQGVKAGAGGWA